MGGEHNKGLGHSDHRRRSIVDRFGDGRRRIAHSTRFNLVSVRSSNKLLNTEGLVEELDGKRRPEARAEGWLGKV